MNIVVVCLDESPCVQLPNPCNDNGNCFIDDDGSIQCECAAGWNGTSCELGKSKSNRKKIIWSRQTLLQ